MFPLQIKIDGLNETYHQNTPKVALLFLTRGPMPLEPVWRDFLEDSFIPWSMLFAIHVHPGQGIMYPDSNIFSGKELKDRVTVQWGNHSMVR